MHHHGQWTMDQQTTTMRECVHFATNFFMKASGEGGVCLLPPCVDEKPPPTTTCHLPPATYLPCLSTCVHACLSARLTACLFVCLTACARSFAARKRVPLHWPAGPRGLTPPMSPCQRRRRWFSNCAVASAASIVQDKSHSWAAFCEYLCRVPADSHANNRACRRGM